MNRFRGRHSPTKNPTNDLPPTLISPVVEHIMQELVTTHHKSKRSRALAVSSSAVALSIVSSSWDPLDAGPGELESSKESGWRTAYGTARMAVEIANASSDMFLPLKAVVGALSVLIKNYDQTIANEDKIGDIEGRIQSLGEMLAPLVGDEDAEERARREALKRKLSGIMTRLKPLSERHGIVKFLKNVDHANSLNDFVQDLTRAVTDYQISVQRSIHEDTKRIDAKTNRICETANKIDKTADRIDETTKKIDESTQNIIETAVLELLEKLNPVHDAGYQAGHHDTCLRGTRESILDEIMQWANDPQERRVFWLNGLAGTGKSTIAQTFSEIIANSGNLGASFFCSRDYLDRKELKNIFPTLAYQLACRYPAFRSQIIRVIKKDPSGARNSLISQLNTLIVNPLSSTNISCTIVVDALDECVDDQPASAILSVLGRYVKQLPSVKFFITGRPEPRIRTGFRLPLLEPFTQIFLLHEVKLSTVDEDIKLYLRETLTSIAKRRSDVELSDPWPCDDDLTALTKKSSGLFIFASTLTRFIESEHHEPGGRLQLIVNPSDSTIHEGRAGIDQLYIQVLEHAFSNVKEVIVFANLRRVLGALILAFHPLSRNQIATILEINSSLIGTSLRHLHSLLLVPKEDSKQIRVFHKSFPDFLQDRDRCPHSKFFIDPAAHHGDLALDCLELLKKLKPNFCDLPDFVMNRDVNNLPELLEDKAGAALRYACGYWAMHIRSSPTTKDYVTRLITSAIEFFKNCALPWIEFMSLDNKLEGVIHNIYNLLDWLGSVDVSTFELRGLAEDCLRFTMNFFHLIQQSAPHIYHSALPLSPRSSIFYSMIIRGRTRVTGFDGNPDTWGAVMRTIKGRFTSVTAFSHRIAATCDDGTVGIYDSVTGVQRLSLNPEDPVRMIKGLPDGSLLFCLHPGPSITLWDVQTGGLTDTFVLEQEAEDFAISLNGHYLACAFSGGSVKVWDIAAKTECAAIQSDLTATHLCWLAPEERIAIVEGALVYIWDLYSGEVLHSFVMQDQIRCAVYSQNLDRLATMAVSNSHVSTIAIIDPQKYTVPPKSYGVARELSCLTFSQTTDELLCGGATPGLELVTAIPLVVGRPSKYPHTVTSLSSLASGTVVTNVADTGIQLLGMDGISASSQQSAISAFTVQVFDRNRIIVVSPPSCDRFVLVETASILPLFTIHFLNSRKIPTDYTAVLCASLGNQAVACYFGGKARKGQMGQKSQKAQNYLLFWRFDTEGPKWRAAVRGLPSIGGISPSGAYLVTLHDAHLRKAHICVWNTENGQPRARLQVNKPCPVPLHIEFELEMQHRFYFQYDTYRVPHDFDSSQQNAGFTIRRNEPRNFDPSRHQQTFTIHRYEREVLSEKPEREQYHVGDCYEWVVSDSKKICWIPPGYIRSGGGSYCWAGSRLVMAGQDGLLRALSFRDV